MMLCWLQIRDQSQAKALVETKSVTIALPDRPLGKRVRTANILEVKGE
jgi:hypothetical protein